MGVLPGIIGTLQANEVLKIILKFGELMVGRFLLFDASLMEFSELKINKNDNCEVCSDNPSITELIDYKQFCDIESTQKKYEYGEIDVIELHQQIKNGNPPKIIDVREDFELEISKLKDAIHIPMNEIPNRINELNINGNYVIICRTGARSAHICEYLVNQQFGSVSNLIGGINEWAKKIDPSQQIY